ncbi:TetR/AcrR family transcriptional regulator [Nisaea acidiphila]|uniref:TetR/AcrR family transcriptional regulator n=1 Tax=Nisaea acidiphila TaxID=1862145 RepID=A0A9J7AT94_9PROT|nr:TetR/AcrR family transcriptional regulator [Nisaea acidiphila]UUX50552.1 TetR/AcrR family transcriptional regulator [Nisaea acidiphila]
MRTETRAERHREISRVAYDLLRAYGYNATSMLRIAKAAKASNQTMYRWYGDKRGLFQRMVEDNAGLIRDGLGKAMAETEDPLVALERLGPVLICVLLSERPILLNRAAASDCTGELGRVIAEGGRNKIVPLIEELVARAMRGGTLKFDSAAAAANWYVDLMIGDLQIRRVIDAIEAPTQKEVTARANSAFAAFLTLGRASVSNSQE